MISHIKNQTYDAVIIGARCAGAATGMLLARAGAKVLIVDRDARIGDTLSTHALMRPAVSLLSAWGLIDQVAEHAPCVTQTTFHYGNEEVTVPIRPTQQASGLFAPRRWHLDQLLLDAAEAAGADIRLGHSCDGLFRSTSGAVTGVIFRDRQGRRHRIRCRMLIGADGRSSRVAELVGAPLQAYSPDRSATVYGYISGLSNQGYRWFYGDGIAAGAIPTNDGQHCLFASCKPNAFRQTFGMDAAEGAAEIFEYWEPAIAELIRSNGFSDKMRRYGGAPGHIRACAGDGWALVGDAGYFKDPATAHGITDAFLDANRLSRALEHTPGDGSSYQMARNLNAPGFFNLTQRIASLECDIETLKGLHIELNAFMKAESTELESELQHTRDPMPLAAA